MLIMSLIYETKNGNQSYINFFKGIFPVSFIGKYGRKTEGNHEKKRSRKIKRLVASTRNKAELSALLSSLSRK